MGPPEAEAPGQELDADENPDDEARQAHQGVAVPAADADDHPQGAPQEHQRPDHHEHRDDKPQHGGGTALGPELLPREGDGRGPKDQPDDLRADVLDDARPHLRVEARPLEVQRPGDVPQEAGDAEAHVVRVAQIRQQHRRRACRQSRADEQAVALCKVLFFHVVLLSCFCRDTERRSRIFFPFRKRLFLSLYENSIP